LFSITATGCQSLSVSDAMLARRVGEGVCCEDAQDKDDWKLRIKETTG